MGKVKPHAAGGLPDMSETPSESHASKSSSPEVALGAVNSQQAGRPEAEIDTSCLAAPHAKKLKLQQQLQNVERQVTARHTFSVGYSFKQDSHARQDCYMQIFDLETSLISSSDSTFSVFRGRHKFSRYKLMQQVAHHARCSP